VSRNVKPLRTEQRGLRPYSNQALDPFSQQKLAEVGEEVEKTISSYVSDSPKSRFLLSQVVRLCDFRLAKDRQIRDQRLREVDKGEDEGHRLGFTSDELRLLIRWVLEQDLAGKAEELRQRIVEKIGEGDDRS
jgi:hypothetical protein